jgi:hypothetical protein
MATKIALKPYPPPDDPNESWLDQLAPVLPPVPLTPLRGKYELSHYAGIGLWLGGMAGCVSLLLNVIGSVLWPAISGVAQHPLRLIQVYLTLPLGESALRLDGGLLLALGCLMYLATGMLYGMLFVVLLSYFVPNAGVAGRLIACSCLALIVWGVNFYGVLHWLQPWLWGDRWITILVPWWVAALTHLVFGWTIALTYPLVLQPAGSAVESECL